MRVPRLRFDGLCQLSALLALIIAASALAGVPCAHADALVFHASASGQQTLDQGEGGGNPFASSLIDILARPAVRLGELPAALQQMTDKKSRGFQAADVPKAIVPPDWQLVPPRAGEQRVALVLVISDYAKSGGAPSLPGARHDAQRMASALTKAGFDTETSLDLDLPAMRRTLADFAAKVAAHEAAVIYTTGHGVEVGGSVYLLPGDYPVAARNTALASRALRLSEVAAALRARRVNLLFYGGCRDNPFGG